MESDIFPAWMNRLGTFVGIAVLAAMCAVAAWWSLLILGVGGGQFFGATIVHGNLVLPIGLACGAVVGLAGASGRARDRVLRRSVAASLVLLAAGVAAIVIWSSYEPDFSAAEFRSARVPGKAEELQVQAYRAVQQDALVGLTPTQLRQALGEPTRIERRPQRWVWRLGPTDSFFGSGGTLTLYVTFDPKGSRVTSAKVE
jgi:hypothetical protein